MKCLTKSAMLAGLAMVFSHPAVAMPYTLPPDSGVKSVRDYGAKGDGVTDDTEAIQRAISATPSRKMLYIPDGTYLISDTLVTKRSDKPNDWLVFLSIQGQSRDKTILRLIDGAPGFNDPKNPKHMLRTREGNMAFVYRFGNFTLDTGKGNPGASGIKYISCNMGSLGDLRVQSGDPSGIGVCGIDTDGDNPGLSLVYNAEVIGFDDGIRFGGVYPGMAFEHIVLSGQRKSGVRCGGTNGAVFRDVRSIGSVPALVVGDAASITLLDSEIGGSNDAPGMMNKGRLLVRNIRFGKGTIGIPGMENETHIAEYASEKPIHLFPSTEKTLKLPIEEVPEIPWDAEGNFANWISVVAHGAKPDSKNDDTDAIQAAIDTARRENKSTVYFPAGKYRVSRTLEIGGSVRRLVGFPAVLEPIHKDANWPNHGSFAGGNEPLMFRVRDGQPVVVFDRLLVEGVCDHAAANTLVFRLGCGVHYRNSVSGGKAFFQDYGAMYEITGPQKVWVRNWNPTWGSATYKFFKNPEDKAYATNDGGTMVFLGVDHESGKNRHALLRNLNGAKTEIFSILSWINKDEVKLFENRDSRLTITGLRTQTGVNMVDNRHGWERISRAHTSALIVCDSPASTTPPPPAENLTAVAGDAVWPFPISLIWDAVPTAIGYEILRDGSHLAWTETTRHVDGVMADDSEYSYEVVALNAALQRSEPSRVSARTGRDIVTLSLKEAFATAVPPRVHLVFSKPLDLESATMAGHYSISPNTSIEKAEIDPGQRSITLHLPALVAGREIAVRASNIRDMAKQPSTLSPTNVRCKVLGPGTGLIAEYFSNNECSGTPTRVRKLSNIDLKWKNMPPVREVPADGFSVRFTGSLRSAFSDSYTFAVDSADGVKLWVDGLLLLDTWEKSSGFKEDAAQDMNRRLSSQIVMQAGRQVPIRLDFRKRHQKASVELRWFSHSQPEDVISQDYFYPPVNSLAVPAINPVHASSGTGLTGIYHIKPYDFRPKPVLRVDPVIDFNWGEGAHDVIKGIKGDWFAIEWQGFLLAPASGEYRFGMDLGPKDQAEVLVDGKQVIDGKTWFGKETNSMRGASVHLRAGEPVPIHLFYREEDSTAKAVLWWEHPGGRHETIPKTCLFPFDAAEKNSSN